MKKILLFTLIYTSITSCNDRTQTKASLFNEQEWLKNIENEDVTCKESTELLNDQNNSQITECQLFFYSFQKEITTDLKGVEKTTSVIFKKGNEIKNSDIFNEKSQLLLDRISSVILDKTQSLDNNCYKDLKKENITFNDFEIYINEFEMFFYLPFKEDCPQIGTSVELGEIPQYLVL